MAATWQIFVAGIDGKTFTVNIAENETVDKLLEEICEYKNLQKEEVWAQFGGKPLVFNQRHALKHYNLRNLSTVHLAVRLRGGVKPRLSSGSKQDQAPILKELQGHITLTDEPCMISLDDDSNEKRAKMPCGHAISVESMTSYCQSLLDSEKYVFHCPYMDEHNEPCTKVWDYFLVRHVACLNVAEQKQFEKKLHENFASRAMGMQQCPGCSSFCFRENKTDKVVRCPLCSRRNVTNFDFCWGCLQQTSRSECPNPDCTGEDPRLNMLKQAVLKKVGSVENCPSVRACPTCGILINHKEACKHMDCPSCKTSFCFVCLMLKRKDGYQCGSWNSRCRPAPVQTVIPQKD